MKILKKLGICMIIISLNVYSGQDKQLMANKDTIIKKNNIKQSEKANFNYTVNPDVLEISINVDDVKLPLSTPQSTRKVSNFKKLKNNYSWEYPNDKIKVELSKNDNYLDISIKYQGGDESSFSFPHVNGDNYALPIGEGKWIPSNDETWKNFLNEAEYDTLESFSMPFFASGYGEKALLYILTDNWDNNLIFSTKDKILFEMEHTFISIKKDKSYNIRVYPVDNNPVDIAKTYKKYVEETKGIKTLKEKAIENPNIEKLYGAPHIYLFDINVISEKDIVWGQFRKSIDSDIIKRIQKVSNNTEFNTVLKNIKEQDYVDEYQKTTIIQSISDSLQSNDFYSEKIFPNGSSELKVLLKKSDLTENEIIMRNKLALYDNLLNAFNQVSEWGNDRTIDILDKLNKAGVKSAWIGLDNWEQAYSKPEFGTKANEYGYLLAAYDSYHSIHKPKEEQWITASFSDFPKAYDELTIINKDGTYEAGFGNVGRKINPVYSIPLVDNRMKKIFSNNIAFTSWFIDCDATGEVFNDYSSKHITTKQEDYNARLSRMDKIAKEYNLVIGSEGGNDYAVNHIAFAHGIELPSFSWMDKDMSKNVGSEYHLGKYFSAKGGAPEKMVKQVPVKEKYKKIFLNPEYNVPLFKLVYNDAVITSYHWDWSTLKIKDEVQNRKLYEMLYNVPPMFHLDKFEVEKNIDTIAEHTDVWSNWSKKIINLEMSDFKVLSKDRIVQMAVYGENKIIVNFSNNTFKYEDIELPAHSATMFTNEGMKLYVPN